MRSTVTAIIAVVLAGRIASAAGPDSTIKIDAAKVLNRVTPLMYGSCIEDVNHEIYGGLYAQLIFGESFEEPPPSFAPIAGWKSYGGDWIVTGDALRVGARQQQIPIVKLRIRRDTASNTFEQMSHF